MSDFGENLWPGRESRLEGEKPAPVDAARAAPPPSEDAEREDDPSANVFNSTSLPKPDSDFEETLEVDADNPVLQVPGDRPVDDGIEPFGEGDLTTIPPAVDESKRSDEPAIAAGHEPWEPNDQARHVAVELRRVEMEIRELLENCDNKRKRKYEGTRRWLELMEDLVAMRYTGPADEATLAKVSALVARRMYLFNMLNFIVATRHRWNT